MRSQKYVTHMLIGIDLSPEKRGSLEKDSGGFIEQPPRTLLEYYTQLLPKEPHMQEINCPGL